MRESIFTLNLFRLCKNMYWIDSLRGDFFFSSLLSLIMYSSRVSFAFGLIENNYKRFIKTVVFRWNHDEMDGICALQHIFNLDWCLTPNSTQLADCNLSIILNVYCEINKYMKKKILYHCPLLFIFELDFIII